MSGFITLHRKMLEWEWYTDTNTKVVFIHCLLKANHRDRKYRGDLIKRGSFVTSLDILAQETNLTVNKVRLALKKLKSTGEITVESTNKGTSITLVKWDDYQHYDSSNNKHKHKQGTKQTTNKPQTNHKQTTTNNNDNNVNNDNKYIYGEFENVRLTDSEYHKLLDKHSEELTADYVERLSAYIAQTGRRYKSHYATILSWIRRDEKNKSKTPKTKVKEIAPMPDFNDIVEIDIDPEEAKRIRERLKKLGGTK